MNILKNISILFCLSLVLLMLDGAWDCLRNRDILPGIFGVVVAVTYFIITAFAFVELEAIDENNSSIA